MREGIKGLTADHKVVINHPALIINIFSLISGYLNTPVEQIFVNTDTKLRNESPQSEISMTKIPPTFESGYARIIFHDSSK